jgi:hypothetical protein
MPKSKSLPETALRLGTYEELTRFVGAFAEGHLNFVMVVGDPGLGKSRRIREALGPEIAWIDGNATAFGVYIEAYEHRDEPIVLDDVDALHREPAGIRLLKGLCQSEPQKALSWQSDARTLKYRGIPTQFLTSSRVAMIANEWWSANVHVAALEDRGHLVVFDPSPEEVHRHAAEWFWDQEIFDFVGEHLHLVKRPSLRTYVLAWEQKRAGLNWQELVLGRCLSGKLRMVARLKADPRYRSEADRVQEFIRSGGGCRATYFNYARKLRPCEPAPKIKLTNSKPPKSPSAGSASNSRPA